MFLILAQSNDPGVLTYFFQSNTAGQLIILALGVFSALAWTVMIGKAMELKQLYDLNTRFESTIEQSNSLLELAQTKVFSESIPYAALVKAATHSYFRAVEIDAPDTDQENAVSHAENALQRAVADQSLNYERKMVLLASIVTGAPFMGLLGTVWGVMDAFGAIGLGSTASIASLAPGVSGALLTTVAGLLVAIPSVFGYNFLLSLTKKRVIELENFASSLVDRIELEDTASKRFQ
ncbi:MAG: flagellar motor protein MotA [Opitutaceae bacterium]|nr:flagellar motor protein MotA [Opitutaceae bacterium]|tara:strand:- start:2284 stop:2991 length:708 start_codon:yes stop_codon:yes gene_type:complete